MTRTHHWAALALGTTLLVAVAASIVPSAPPASAQSQADRICLGQGIGSSPAGYEYRLSQATRAPRVGQAGTGLLAGAHDSRSRATPARSTDWRRPRPTTGRVWSVKPMLAAWSSTATNHSTSTRSRPRNATGASHRSELDAEVSADGLVERAGTELSAIGDPKVALGARRKSNPASMTAASCAIGTPNTLNGPPPAKAKVAAESCHQRHAANRRSPSPPH